MSECFDSKVSVTQTILDPRTDTKHIIDFQYERERRTPKPIPSPKNYTQHVDELRDKLLAAAGLAFVLKDKQIVARESIKLPVADVFGVDP
jgi:hypothetical protein